MRVRLTARKKRRIKAFITECAKCLLTREFDDLLRELTPCPNCGSTTGRILRGRIDWVDDGHAQERVDEHEARHRRQVEEATRHGAGRKLRARLARKDSMAAEKRFAIVKRDPAKVAAAGSTKTGAKVEKIKAGKGMPGSASGRNIGRTTGLSIAKFQNKTIEENRKRHLTDEQLVRLWKSEFPNAKSDYTTAIVSGVRGLYNRGKHGNDAPKVPVPQYDEDGNALPFRGERAAAAREAREARVTERTAPVAKKGKVVVKKKAR